MHCALCLWRRWRVVDPVVVGVFLLVYVGMILGKVPTLRLDRAGIAAVGAVVLIGTRRISATAAWSAVDLSTLALLLGLMVVSSHLYVAGFYSELIQRLAPRAAPTALLALVIATAGGLSAILGNEMVCLALTPVLIQVCARRGLDPIPFILALACASNVGSAATLIGNPQNVLIGQTLQMSFSQYLLDAGVPAALGLMVVWSAVWLSYRGRWSHESPEINVHTPAFDRQQSWVGIVVIAGVVAALLLTGWPRERIALAAAVVLVVSRRLAVGQVLRLVNWRLLVLFVGLFVVNRAIAQSGLVSGLLMTSRGAGLDVTTDTKGFFFVSAVLSTFVAQVPAVMLLLPAARDELAATALALSSTLAGNWVLTGSVASIIVVDQAKRLGLRIDRRRHARVGIPVTLATLATAAAWLFARP